MLLAEIKWQKKFKAVENKNFYNLVYGQSMEGSKHTPETIEKIRNSQIGKPKSDYYHSTNFSEKVKLGMLKGKPRKEHIYTKEENYQNSLRIKAYFQNGGINGMKGKKHSEETKRKMREKAKQRPKKFGKETSCYGKKTVNNGITNKMVVTEEVSKYLAEGWNLGRVKKM